MFLKRLTMKGFKSFADATTLEFEQGVTAVVGPNGSGKSNVVDAVAWVLGAQSARALRSGKMEDVIFAGTANRPALGRAEVTLTLDNADGRLSIDGAEVTISRTLFRNGDSEYAINGTTCRLLDIQELLSDSGVGRQQHMIIGQGQLDSVLNSRSEDRRAVIEEAAGVLKHRRRKERAERRLGQTQENLERLGDLVREVRRQMRPLERQAAAARNFADVDSELRNVRRALYSDRLRVFETRRGELDSVLRTSDGQGRELRNELVRLDAQASAAAAEVASRREEHLASTLGQLQGLAERVRGTLGLINERRRSVRATLEASADENVVANLEADAAKLAADLLELTMVETELAPQRVEIETARTSLNEAEAQFEATWGEAVAGQSEASLARVQEQAEIVQRSVDTGRQGLERVNARRSGATSRAEEVRAARETAVNARGEAERAVAEATVAHGHATVQEREAEDRIRTVESELRELTDTAARTQARAEALARALEEFSGGGGRSLIGELDGVLGAFLDLVEVEPGWEKAVESAAGASLGAVVVDGRTSAHAALSALRRDGGAGLILPAVAATGERPSAPAGCESLRSRVSVRPGTPDDVVRVLDALFARAFVARDWESGIDIALSNPDLIVVTADGDRFAATGWRVASGRAVVTRSSVEEAHAVARIAADHVEPATEAALKARTANNEARTAVRESLNTLTKAEATLDRWTKEGIRLEAELTTVEALVTSSTTEATEATEALGELEFELSTLLQQLPALELAVSESSQRAAWADEARVTLEAHRAQVATLVSEVGKREAELGERRRLIESRQSDVERRLAGHAAERAEATERRQSLEFELQSLDRLEVIVRQAGDDVHLNQEALESTYREQLEASRAGAEQLEALRRERTVTEARLTELGDTGRKAEIEHAELAIKVTTLHDSIRRDIEIEPEELGLVAAPELPEGVTLEHRLVELETRINALGPINPLALEELTALESRYQELDGQVADVRHARRELQEVVRALDEEIMTTFSSAMADVNEHFSSLIAMLFPGGQGRLMLTDPEDLLNTGVEIEVRPMGRNVRRVSLLSGGERSLAALAFLFAVFRSRPSPFYMMDEVEAALDDVNLQRFLSLVADFRDEAQLLMVTHQKRTMESADALYGVTMVPGASSKVVSQRVKRTKES